jgi:hypothetical protein
LLLARCVPCGFQGRVHDAGPAAVRLAVEADVEQVVVVLTAVTVLSWLFKGCSGGWSSAFGASLALPVCWC